MTEPNTTSVGFRRLVAASTFASLFALALSVTISPAAVNKILPQLCHNSYALFGWMFPVWSIAFFTCILLGSRYADKHGKLPMLSVGCILIGIGTFLLGQASTYTTFLVAAFVMGAGGGLCEGNSMALIADVFGDARRTSMMNFSQVFFAAGAVIGPVTVSRLIAANCDWRWAFIGTAGLCLLAAVLCLCGHAKREETLRQHHEEGTWRILLKDKLVLLLSLGILLYVGAESGQGSWIAAYFKHELKATGPLAASTVALFWGGVGLGRAAAAWSSRHISDFGLICWSLAVAALSQAGLLLLQSPIPALFMVLVLGFALGPVWPTIVSRGGAAHPLQSGAVMGIVISAGAIGAAIFPPLIGQAGGAMGLRAALWICFALLIINFAIFLSLWRRNRARSEAP